TTTYSPSTLATTITQPGSLSTVTTKDLLGRVVRVKDPEGNVETITYNSLGWKLSDVHPVTGTTTWSYDDAGKVTQKTDANGKTVKMVYDAAGRVQIVDYAPFGNSTCTHATQSVAAEDTCSLWDYATTAGDPSNGKGQVVKVTDPAGTTQFGYDVAGR